MLLVARALIVQSLKGLSAMNSGYFSIDGHTCYISNITPMACDVVLNELYDFEVAPKVADKLKELLDANGYILNRVYSKPATRLRKSSPSVMFGIVITGIRMEEVLKWQQI